MFAIYAVICASPPLQHKQKQNICRHTHPYTHTCTQMSKTHNCCIFQILKLTIPHCPKFMWVYFHLRNVSLKMAPQKAASVFIFAHQLIMLWDLNNANLSQQRPKCRQYIKCPSRHVNTSDYCYTALKDPYYSVPHTALGLSNHCRDGSQQTDWHCDIVHQILWGLMCAAQNLTYNKNKPWFNTRLVKLC